MLDIKFIRENPKLVEEGSLAKHIKVDVAAVLKMDEEKRALQTKSEEIRAEQKLLSAKIPKADKTEKEKLLAQTLNLKQEFSGLEEKLNELEVKLRTEMLRIPNIAFPEVKVGKDESENVVIREVGKIPTFSFTPKEHWQLGEELGIIDNERAAKVSGARFTYIKGKLALLQFAIINFAFRTLTDEKILSEIAKKAGLDVSTKAFIPVVPPMMIKPEAFERMARLEPREERYHIPSDDIYLVGSAEHTLGSMHMDETLDEKDLPARYVGYSTSFRREAGSYGKDTRGIIRLHQFDKIEIESFTAPEDSTKEQDFIVAIQSYLLSALGIAHRIVGICTGDMGAPDARQIDLEAWLPGQNTYRETNTSDLNTDYQSRRLNTRLRRKDGKHELVHMNDATVFALGRTMVAIMENYQQADGSIKIPDVLIPYCGFDIISKK
jgi:seryl-tRNA synthetase